MRLQTGDMVSIRRAITLALFALSVVVPGSEAQERDANARDAYFRGVAEFFSMPMSEVSILGAWRLPPEEIPVALFVARQAGVSPEALVALRRTGKSWSELATRYHLGAAPFYVPLADGAPAGVLSEVYDRYRKVPTAKWGEVSLTDQDIVGLVNLRLLTQTLHMEPERVLGRASSGQWVELYVQLLRGSGPEQGKRVR